MAGLERVLDFFSRNPSNEEITEFLLLADIILPNPLACSIYLRNQNGELEMSAQTGLEAKSVKLSNDKWNVATSQIPGVRALRQGFPVHLPVEEVVKETERLGFTIPYRENVEDIWILPLLSTSGPFGALLFYMGSLNDTRPRASNISFELLQKVFAVFYHGDKFRDSIKNKQRTNLLLTERQKRILEDIARGLTNDAIANEENISLGTAKLEVRRILEAMVVESRKEAVAKAIRDGLI